MGSDSDWNVMREASELLDEFGVAHEVEVVSAHRTPEKMIAYGKEAAGRGIRVIIAGAGGAAHLPGMLASVTTLPVVGVPVPLSRLDGLDSLLSIVQMPAGVPVATVAVGGARNAGLLAVRILAATDPALRVDGRHTAYGRVVPQRDWPQGTRLHTRSDDLEQVLLDALAAWAADGSVVLSRGPEPEGPAQDRLRERLDAEGVSLQR